MALGDPYATLTELKARVDLADTVDDAQITDALNSVSREIERHCKRQFNKATAATARVYQPTYGPAEVDDLWTLTDLVIATDADGDGVYETTWSASDYQLEPLNGVVDGEIGWPWFRIRPVGTLSFPTIFRRAPLQVSAQWGWTAVPAPVHEACLILAAETFKLGEAPWGVANMDQFGPIRVRDNPVAVGKLEKYRRRRTPIG